jgi:Putative adhesin
MSERCKNCGAELFTGQQFCRQCGARTGLLAHDDVATQMLPQQQPSQQPNAPAATVPLAGERGTDPNFSSRPTAAYRPQQVTPLAPAAPPPARRRGSLGWTLFVVLLCAFGAICVAGFYAFQKANQPTRIVRIVKPPVPPGLTNAPPPNAAADEDTDTLDEDGADVSEDKTVITKTFPLAMDAGQFELSNVNGDVRIAGWDEPQAEVKVTKHGGTPEDREGVEIKVVQSGNHLALQTATREAGQIKDVLYEVKLPRRLTHLALNTTNGDIKLADIHANIEIATQHGDIKLAQVGGAITTNSLAGDTKVALADTGVDAPLSFNTVNGNVEVQLSDTANAQVRADTTAGEIKSDDSLGLKVEKQMVGQHIAGQLGRGGPPITIKTVHGDIKIKK